MKDIISEIRSELLEMADNDYKAFNSKLLPTVPSDRVIGIRTPVLKKYALQKSKEPGIKRFLETLPHYYYEENNLHAFIIMREKDFDKAVALTEAFLPFVDNWATCDSFIPKSFEKSADKLLPFIDKWIRSSETYTVRFAIGLYMRYFLDDKFRTEYLDKAVSAASEEYYINMMIAWYFATALAKQYDHTIVYLENNKLPVWIHNKTIQKAVESYRISDERKAYLRTLRVK